MTEGGGDKEQVLRTDRQATRRGAPSGRGATLLPKEMQPPPTPATRSGQRAPPGPEGQSTWGGAVVPGTLVPRSEKAPLSLQGSTTTVNTRTGGHVVESWLYLLLAERP